MWSCPVDELQSVLLCILVKNVNWTRGEGGNADMSSPVFRTQMAQTCLWLSAGEGAAELPVSKDGWIPRSSEDRVGRAPRALAYKTSLSCGLSSWLTHWIFRATFPSSFKSLLLTIQRNRKQVTFCEAWKLRTHRGVPGDQNLREAEETHAWSSCCCSCARTWIWMVFDGQQCLETLDGSVFD